MSMHISLRSRQNGRYFADDIFKSIFLNENAWISITISLNTLRPRQNARHLAFDIFWRIFLNENVWIPIKMSLKFVSEGPINNVPALVQIMAWCRLGDKPLSEPVMITLPRHVFVPRPQSHIDTPIPHLLWIITVTLFVMTNRYVSIYVTKHEIKILR